MASPHLLLHPHWVIINTLKTVCEHSYQETNHFHAQPTQNTLTWTQEKASGEAEVPEYTDWESDCNCIQVHPILQVSRLSRDVRSSPLGGAHNLVSNQGQILSPSPQLVQYSFSLICRLISSRHRMEFSGAQIKSHPFGRRLLQENQETYTWRFLPVHAISNSLHALWGLLCLCLRFLYNTSS